METVLIRKWCIYVGNIAPCLIDWVRHVREGSFVETVLIRKSSTYTGNIASCFY